MFTVEKAIIGETALVRLRVLLVEDHELVREALKALLQTDPGLEIVGEAATFAEGLEAVERLKPTVAVIDVGLPDGSGIELANQLKVRRSSTHHPRALVGRHAEIAGDRGDGDVGDRRVEHLHEGAQRERHRRQRLRPFGKRRRFAHEAVSAAAGASWYAGVTRREREVLTYVAMSLTNKQIAHALNISVKTVEKHRGNLMRKLNVHGVAALTRVAIHEGLVRANPRQTPAQAARVITPRLAARDHTISTDHAAAKPMIT